MILPLRGRVSLSAPSCLPSGSRSLSSNSYQLFLHLITALGTALQLKFSQWALACVGAHPPYPPCVCMCQVRCAGAGVLCFNGRAVWHLFRCGVPSSPPHCGRGVSLSPLLPLFPPPPFWLGAKHIRLQRGGFFFPCFKYLVCGVCVCKARCAAW